MPFLELLECRLRGIHVEEAVTAIERLTGALAIEALPPSSLIYSDELRVQGLHASLARVLSVVAAALGLIFTAPVFGLIAVLVRLDSPGPVFFVHERVGLGGRRFGLLKFRTMSHETPKRSEWVRDNGHRLTRLGRWLRRFRLDELPQFVNVLRGDMNLVGPRPHPVANFERFMARIPYYWMRGAVPPGITGWAQVRYGYANGLEEETQTMCYDLYYIKHLSLWLDLCILAEAVAIVLLGRERPERGPQPAAVEGRT
jgi:lipopolysaccharide/colanic/teichoic acid biosynthesis glycosyltransferase